MLKASDFSLIVLAGGKSSRMGQDKSLMPFGEHTMIEHILKTFRPHFEELIVSADRADKFERLDLKNAAVCEDTFYGEGPLAGIYAGLCASRRGRSFVVTCDMPYVNEACFARLLSQTGESEYDFYGFETNGEKRQPFPGIFSKEIRNLIRILLDQKERSLQRLFDVCDAKWILQGKLSEKVFTNMNRMGDYQQVMESEKAGVK